MQRCALGTVHVLLLHAALRVSCVPCEWIQDSHPVVVHFLCGISNLFASYLEDVPIVMSIGSKLFVRHKCRVFDASPEHTTLLHFLVSAVPTRKKNIQKVSEGETCVSSKLQSRRGRATKHESE